MHSLPLEQVHHNTILTRKQEISVFFIPSYIFRNIIYLHARNQLAIRAKQNPPLHRGGGDFHAASTAVYVGNLLEQELNAAEELLNLVICLFLNGLAIEVLRRENDILEQRVVRAELDALRTKECTVLRCEN